MESNYFIDPQMYNVIGLNVLSASPDLFVINGMKIAMFKRTKLRIFPVKT